MFLIFCIILVIAILYRKNSQFKKTTYHQITHNSLAETWGDKGKYGEYLTYRNLRYFEDNGGKFLFNCYIPKGNGETTEIDVLLICEGGVFAFESKNYSGWIFGSEKAKYWTQTLPAGRGKSHKEHFFNPVMQNKTHIKWLHSLIGDAVPIYSVIVFSERCELKKIEIYDRNVAVVKRNKIHRIVNQMLTYSQADCKLVPSEIERIYNTIYPYTQVTETQKEQHVENIKRNHGMSAPYQTSASMKEDTANDHASLDRDPNMEGQALICPKCGGKLLLRTAKKGAHAGEQFYGCQNYPKCHYKA